MKKLPYLLLIISIITGCSSSDKTVRFAIISDIHQDIMHDGEERLQTFINTAADNNVDFIIDLGDFCFPKDLNRPFLNIWNSFDKDKYHVLGNHDMDICSKDEYISFTGMPARYYSFDKGSFHFIVLDANNIYDNEEYIHYNKGNYYIEAEKREFIDPEQIEWLTNDLKATNKRCIIFSHQSLECSIGNREDVRAVLEKENERAGFNKIPVAFNGHDHTNYTKEINGIMYIQINSASNQWVGSKYACPERFSDEINQKKTSLKYTTPYKDVLYAIVSLNGKSMDLKGVESSFIPPTPNDLGIPNGEQPLVPWIKDFNLKF